MATKKEPGKKKTAKKEAASSKEKKAAKEVVGKTAPIAPPASRIEPIVPRTDIDEEVGMSEEEFSRIKEGNLRYFEAVGRRKTAIARVRVFTKPGDFTVNEKPYAEYFPTMELQKIVEDALQKMKLFGRFRVSVKVFGGGIHAQAEATRHGLARCLIRFNPNFRKRLKRAGFLRRDPRVKERKKFGLKKARRAPQWAKR